MLNKNDFEQKGFNAITQFLSIDEAAQVRADLDEFFLKGELKEAGIGKNEDFKVDRSQRGDLIRWINPGESAPATRHFFETINELIRELNREFFLGIRGFESHYTQYPAGTFYKKHVDRHKSGSHRVVSFVLYLNDGWKKEDGGELIIYHEDGASDRIEPLAGTLAVFLSEKEHEVLATNAERKSITGWMLDKDELFF